MSSESSKIDFFENGLLFYCRLATTELSIFREFHEKTEQLWNDADAAVQAEINSVLQEHPSDTHDEIVESYGWDLHMNQSKFPGIHRNAVVLSVYAFLEDQLNGLCKLVGDSMGAALALNDIHGRGVERAFTYLSKVGGFDLSAATQIAFIRDVNRLRNRLVHAGGVLPSNANDAVNRFVQSSPDLVGEPDEQMRIKPAFVDRLINNVRMFLSGLDEQVHLFIKRTGDAE